MLAGERFGDRPASVCPVIGAILRAYNDNVDDRRRQDLYRFAADAVDTRRNYHAQRRRADAALAWAVGRRGGRGGSVLSPPDPEGPRDEIGYYVVGALVGRGSRRGCWSDDEHAAMIALLEQLIEIDYEPALEPVIEEPRFRDLLEHVAEPVEHGSGYHEFVLAEGLECGAQARLEASAPLLDEHAPVVGERREHHAPVAVGALPIDEARRREPFQHLGDARRAQIRGIREVAERHLTLVSKAEQQAVLCVGELARVVGLAPAHAAQGGQRPLERSRHLLGGVAVLALAYHVSRRR